MPRLPRFVRTILSLWIVLLTAYHTLPSTSAPTAIATPRNVAGRPTMPSNLIANAPSLVAARAHPPLPVHAAGAAHTLSSATASHYPTRTAPSSAASDSAMPAPADATVPDSRSSNRNVRVPVLMYHYIRVLPGASDRLGDRLSVSPIAFDQQIAFLAHANYTPITLAELTAARAGRFTLPSQPIVLTFDDGYRDFYTTAWPILRRYHFKATLFIITGVVDTPRYVTWGMLRELDRSGMIEIGSQTIHHLALPGLTAARARDEIVASKQQLEVALGHAIRAFAYPSGQYTARDVNLVREAGYEIAVTTRHGFAAQDIPSLLLPRIRMQDTTTPVRLNLMPAT